MELGYLPQGSYAIYWISNLAYERSSLSQAYAPGGHDFAALIQVDADSDHVLYLDGVAVSVPDSAELDPEAITVAGQSALYSGFRVDVGQLTPGQHSAVWVMELHEDHVSAGVPYAAGTYSFTVNFIVQ